jgi:AcrR family transcriptional regulator
MARTVRAEAAQAVRREAFVDVALRLIQLRGYEQMSVQDVLAELDASKGAFYHYFDSKRALLQAVVDRITDAALAAVAPLVSDPHLSAVQKLEGFFSGIAAWKTERRDLMLAMIEVWVSDDNAIVREKSRRSIRERLVPLLTPIVEQGVEEGLFDVRSPEETATVIVLLVLGLQDVMGDLLFARLADTISFEEVLRRYATYLEALDRVLGLPPGSIKGLDPETMRQWFG